MTGKGKNVRKIMNIAAFLLLVLLGGLLNHGVAEGKSLSVSWRVHPQVDKQPMPTVTIRQVKQKQIHSEPTEYSFVVKNCGDEKVKKIVYSYKVKIKVPDTKQDVVITQDAIIVSEGAVGEPGGQQEEEAGEQTEEQEYKMITCRVQSVVKNILPGESSERIALKIPMDIENDMLEEVELYKTELYSGNACTIHNYRKDRERVVWAKEDVTAPEISGFVNKNSINKNALCNDVYMQVYADQIKEYNFRKYITVTDNRADVVKVQLDFSQVDLKREGIYKVRILAQDKAGNIAKTYTRIQLLIPGSAETIADDILGKIVNKGDSDITKARAIYRYIKGHCNYSERRERGTWRNVALNAFRYHAGDCYSYYAMVRLLCTRAKIPCIKIAREGTDYRHWWNLVYVSGAWYHLDTTPRAVGGEFCLMTDSQLDGYNRGNYNPFVHSKDWYPQVSEERISPDP